MSDLPSLARTPVVGGSTPILVEAIGVGPSFEYEVTPVTAVHLASADVASKNATRSPIMRLSNGDLPFTCERWLRIYFQPPIGNISSLRIWVQNYAPKPGWELYWGSANAFRQPTTSPSPYANAQVPVSDPHTSNLAVRPIAGGVFESDWLVLQASWSGGVLGPIQTTPIDLRMAWTES